MINPYSYSVAIHKKSIYSFVITLFILLTPQLSLAEITLEKQYKVTDKGLYFNGRKVGHNAPDNGTDVYDLKFGPKITAHGDAIKVYKEFIFTTWYRGDKFDRHMMLSRYNTNTGVLKTIEFPHRHTGLRGQWWIGESHNTIAVGISPKNGSIHLLFDMHSYANSGVFVNDYFRYAYSIKNAASVPDQDFTLDLFVKDGPNDYNHVSLNGRADPQQFENLTYPRFFLNNNNDLLMHMRVGGNDNGAYVFSKYNAATSTWDDLTRFNHLNAKNKGQAYNWGLYGSMKYVNGKLRTAFQRRSANKNDKYLYQNGIYYAYSDDQSGKTQWKDHTGRGFNIPFANADIIKIFEPGNLVPATGKNQVYIVGNFDFTVTDRGDVHIISQVKDTQNNIVKNIHSYKPAGSSQFINNTDFSGASQLYTFGNNIYIIGLKNGRPFVKKSDGGKNNFETVYEVTSGQSFSHGVAHIYKGKLYYYLQAKGNSTTLPAYVQIIDLGFGSNEQTIENVLPEGYEFAANEGEIINVTGTMNVAYGAQDQFYFHYNQTSDLECSNAIFGDPIPRTAKRCYSKSTIQTTIDQCDTTSQCRATYPDFTGAIDCANSGSDDSTCLCGTTACDALDNSSAVSSSSLSSSSLSSSSLSSSSSSRPASSSSEASSLAISSEASSASSTPLTVDQCDTTSQCRAIYPVFDGVMDCANSRSEESVCMCGAAPCNSLTINDSNSSAYVADSAQTSSSDVAISSMGFSSSPVIASTQSSSTTSNTASFCYGTVKVPRRIRTEIDLQATNCIEFTQDLSNQKLQVWDSDISDCEIRGKVISIDGQGDLNITKNYESTGSFSGRIVQIISENSCDYIKVRFY